MKNYCKFLLGVCLIVTCASCGRSTEKCASKEHGMKFNIWELYYDADDYDVYWPSVRMPEPAGGAMTVIKSTYNMWGSRLIRRDTISMAAYFKPTIYSVKSKNDAQYYNSICIYVNDADKEFWPGLEHNFIFNEGKKDSVSFTAKAVNRSYFNPSREISEKIIELLSQKDSVSVKISFKGSSVEGVYNFNIEGSPELKKALKINRKRKIQAQEEFEKVDAKYEKALEKLFDDISVR